LSPSLTPRSVESGTRPFLIVRICSQYDRVNRTAIGAITGIVGMSSFAVWWNSYSDPHWLAVNCWTLRDYVVCASTMLWVRLWRLVLAVETPILTSGRMRRIQMQMHIIHTDIFTVHASYWKTHDRRELQRHSKWRLSFVLSCYVHPIGDHNDVQQLSVLGNIFCISVLSGTISGTSIYR